MTEAITIDVDFAKSVFQVHGVDGEGGVVFRRQSRRAQMLSFFRKQPRINRPNTWQHRPACITVKKTLANRELSTHGYERTFRGSSRNVSTKARFVFGRREGISWRYFQT